MSGALSIVPVRRLSSNYCFWNRRCIGTHTDSQAGVLSGENTRKLMEYAKENKVCSVLFTTTHVHSTQPTLLYSTFRFAPSSFPSRTYPQLQ